MAAIGPWNYPFLHALWKTVPALSVGNSVVLKLAEQTPIAAHRIGLLVLEAGIPPGVLNVIHGGPSTGAELVRHPQVRMITFTGSPEVGKAILTTAAGNVTGVHTELGGKTANIVFDDADLDQALLGTVQTAFYNSGQICTSGSRLLVQEAIAAEFIPRLVDLVASLRVGSPTESSTQMGPLISPAQVARVEGYVRLGQDEGATLAIGGARLGGALAAGNFMDPAVFLDVRPRMRIAQEEIFGPVLTVTTFRFDEDAVQIANDVSYGLAATIWTRDVGRSYRVMNELDVGIVWINCPHSCPSTSLTRAPRAAVLVKISASKRLIPSRDSSHN